VTDDQHVAGLGEALHRATDSVAAPGLAPGALVAARRRRARNRGIVAAAAAAAAVIAVSQLPGGTGTEQPVGPLTPTPTPSTTPSADPTLPLGTNPPVDPAAIKPRWDPFSVPAAPLRPSVLPERLDPPDAPTAIADDPMDAAVIAWPEKDLDLRLLGSDGRWRSVPGTADAVQGRLYEVVSPALSPDGRQVAMSTNDGILVVDVTRGRSRTIPWPSGPLAEPSDTAPALRWLPGDQGFVVLHWEGAWLVALDGAGRKAPYGAAPAAQVAVDPGGDVVERRWDERDLRVWRDGAVVTRVLFPYWGERLVARHGRVALTGSGNGLPGDTGPMVLDAATGELVAYAPIRDPDSAYSDNGHLSAVGFLDADTVLLKVGPIRFGEMDVGEESWHLVAWHLDSGAVERLTTGDTRMRTVDVAGDVLAAGRP
jgi:hypothetical protein